MLKGVRDRQDVSQQMSLEDEILICAVLHRLAFLDIGPISEGHTQVIPKCAARY